MLLDDSLNSHFEMAIEKRLDCFYSESRNPVNFKTALVKASSLLD